MELSLLALAYFQKAAQLQHLSKAAAELHIAQPSLSRTIRGLEEELGVPLFDRQGRGIVLSRYGQTVLHYADRILQSVESMRREVQEQKHQEETTVTLSLYAASKIIPPLLTDFRKQHPDVRLQILQQETADAGTVKADLSLFSSMMPITGKHAVMLLEEEILLAMPESDPRAHLRKVPLQDFASDGFIGLQSGKSLRTIMDTYCAMAGFTPRINLECDSPGTVREFIRAGLGVSFVPSITWGSVAGEKVALVPISMPRCRRYIGLSWDEHAHQSAAAQALRDFLLEHFAAYAMASSG